MSRIQGLNDKVTLKRKAIKPAITVWKGEKKTAKSAGKNLANQFRIEAPSHIKSVLKRICDWQEREGSLYCDRLNIVPAYEDEYKTFDCKMAVFTASQPKLFCDGQTIHTEFIQDAKNYVQPIESNKPCPVAGTNHKCPNGCNRTGDFYFYIWELLLAGYSEFARLQVHGVEDNQSIADFLDNTKLEIGAIKNSPFSSDETRTYIIYEMTRRQVKSKYPILENGQRTAKRGTKDDWIINLNLHPIWQRRYDYARQSQQLIASGYQPSQKLIEQVYGETAIASQSKVSSSVLRGSTWSGNPTVSHAQFLVPSNLRGLRRLETSNQKLETNLVRFKQDLAIAFKNNGWTKDGAMAMMQKEFNAVEVSEDLDLELLMAIAKSEEERAKWCDF